MKWIVTILISVAVSFYGGYFAVGKISEKYFDKAVLSYSVGGQPQTTVPSPSPSPTPTPTPIPTATPIPKPTTTPTPTITPVPQPQFSQEEIHGFMERFAGQYGIDVNVLRHIAVCESGFNPLAVNGPYAGLFQFNSTTWKNNRAPMGEDPNPDLRFNAEEATQTAAYLMSLGKFYLWPNCIP